MINTWAARDQIAVTGGSLMTYGQTITESGVSLRPSSSRSRLVRTRTPVAICACPRGANIGPNTIGFQTVIARIDRLEVYPTDSIGIVGQIWREPLFDFCDRFAFAACVIFDLVFGDTIDCEIPGVGMGEIQSADGGRRGHRE